MIDIINTIDGEKRWELTINKEGIYDNVSLRTNYINDRKPAENRDDNMVLLDDDRAMFNKYLQNAIADLTIMTAKYYKIEFSDYDVDENNIYITLSLSENFKDSVAYSLHEYVKEFIETTILMKWYGSEAYKIGIDVELKEVESKIRSTLNYRKTPIRRPFNPVF